MNGSGIKPVGYNVIVKPQAVEVKTKGGLLLPDQVIEKDSFGRTEGVLVAVSPMAFAFEEWPDGEPKPQVGDQVMFSRYNATEMQGRDGVTYWLMKDQSIVGIME